MEFVINKKDIILNKKEFKKRIGIYFLLKKEEIVYVGQTTQDIERIFHHKDKDFDSYYFLEVDKNILDLVEAKNIIKFNPKYNENLNCSFMSLNMIKSNLKKIGVDCKKYSKMNIEKIIKNKKINTYNFKLKGSYILREDFDIILQEVR